MATKLDEALLIELGISDDRLNRELARAYAKAIRDNKKLETELNRVTNGAVENMGAGFQRMGMDAQRSTRMATAGVTGLGAAMQRSRFQIQNASYQISDFAVQVAGGTSASRAFAQQLPQMLGGFGPLGAVIGTLAAVGIPLFTAGLGSMGDQAVDTDQALDEFVKSLGEYRDFLATAGASTLELEETFGSFAAEMRGFAEYMAGVQLGQTMEDFAATMEPLRLGLEGVVGAIRQYTEAQQYLNEVTAQQQNGMATSEQVLMAREAMDAFAQASEDAAAGFGLLPVQAVELKAALDSLAGATGIVEMRDRAGEALTLIQSWFPAGQELSPVLSGIVTQLQKIAGEAAMTTAQMEGMHGYLQLAAGAANALAGGLSAAQGPAAGLLGQMRALAEAAWAAAQNWALARDVANTPAAGGPAGAPIGAVPAAGSDDGVSPGRPQSRPVNIDFGYSPASAGGGSPGGGGTTVAQQPEYWDDLIAKVREAEQVWEEYNQTIESGADAATDFFMSITDGSKTAKEAVADLLMQMARVQMLRGMTTLSGTSGAMGSIFGALGNALSFDGGGYTGSGPRAGGIDGIGGFPAILHPNETVVDHTKPGSGGGASVVFNIDARGATADAAPAIEAAVRRAAPGIIRQAVAASGRAMQSTKSFGNQR